ncbi:hypothetical protein [Burkholderia cepacia]|uniref:hypothetical protein n=1 Tax=Burkholderia cepacia TaxID=292 RepID=UPI000B241E0D|nr:hypothetical protein [Burkholderia cepacia]
MDFEEHQNVTVMQLAEKIGHVVDSGEIDFSFPRAIEIRESLIDWMLYWGIPFRVMRLWARHDIRRAVRWRGSLGSGRTSRLSSNGCSRSGSRPTRRRKQANSFAGAAALRVVRFWITTAPRNLDSLSTSEARIPSIEPQGGRGENQIQR